MHSVQRGRVGRRRSTPVRGRKHRHRVGVMTAGSLVATLAGAGSAGAAVSVGGGAYGVRANVNALLAPASVGALPTVSLPPEGGGPFAESLLSANLAGLAPVGLARVSTEGNSAVGSAKSSAATVDVGVAGLVTASVARSRCAATTTGADGSASVVDLVVAGIPVSAVDAGPNTSITLPVGRVIVNEQRRSGDSQITVNAVHVILSAPLVTADVVVAQSRCTVATSRRTTRRKLRRRGGRA